MATAERPLQPARSKRRSRGVRRRRGISLLEVMAASGLFALLLGGMASSVFLARKCAYEASAGSEITTAGASAFFWMSQDVGEAISVVEATADRLGITVPDRDGDGNPETILYSRNGAELTRQLNGGAVETVIDQMASFQFSYKTRTETAPTTAVYGPEQLLMSHHSSSDLADGDVDEDEQRGQYIEPQLAPEAVSWIATKARLRLRAIGLPNGEATVQLRSASGRLPHGNILAEAVLQERKLSYSYAWIDIAFQPDHEPIAAGTGVCLIVKSTGAGDACEVQYQNDDSTAAGTDYVRSLDGGAWWYAPPEEDLLFELHGKIGTLANDVSKSYLEQVVFRVEAGKPARVLYGSAAALNEPLVGN